MEKGLILKILGKENSVKLEDQVYNLREITDETRINIASNEEIFRDELYIKRFQHELYKISEVLESIKKNMELPENSIGYTNSRVYLKNYIINMCKNIELLIESLKPCDMKKIIYYNNMIADLVLKY